MPGSERRLHQVLVDSPARSHETVQTLVKRVASFVFHYTQRLPSHVVRRDVDRLRELGYPVDAITGVAGGYCLAKGASLPPLLLDDDEAVAVAVGFAVLRARQSPASKTRRCEHWQSWSKYSPIGCVDG